MYHCSRIVPPFEALRAPMRSGDGDQCSCTGHARINFFNSWLLAVQAWCSCIATADAEALSFDHALFPPVDLWLPVSTYKLSHLGGQKLHCLVGMVASTKEGTSAHNHDLLAALERQHNRRHVLVNHAVSSVEAEPMPHSAHACPTEHESLVACTALCPIAHSAERKGLSAIIVTSTYRGL